MGPLISLALVAFSTLGVSFGAVTSAPGDVTGKTFDYIVVCTLYHLGLGVFANLDCQVGAGLTGTTVAARLAENPNITVLLIEAGNDDRTNPEVYNLYKYGEAFNTALDWAWPADSGKTIHG